MVTAAADAANAGIIARPRRERKPLPMALLEGCVHEIFILSQRNDYPEHAGYLQISAAGSRHNRLREQPLMDAAPLGEAGKSHICVVTETYPPEINGVALTLARLLDGLRVRGYVVSLVHPRQRRGERGDSAADFPVTLVPSLPLPGYDGLRVGLPTNGLLRQTWTQRRPDAVYVATQGPLGLSAVQAARRLGVPVFSGFHTNFHSYSRHYRLGWLQPVVLHYLRWFHNRTRGTLVPSLDLRDGLQDMGFRNVSVLSRGVDADLFNPQHRSTDLRREWGAAPDDPVALYVGRVAPEKNVELAIAAFRAMQRRNESAKLVIVGDGSIYTKLRQEHPDLRFEGLCRGEQLADCYASADIFLFPSETETFGNVVLEAMASGIAVVAYDYAAARMHVTSGETGLRVPYADADAFVGAAARLAEDVALRDRIRRQARAHAAALDWQAVVDRFAALLAEAAAMIDGIICKHRPL